MLPHAASLQLLEKPAQFNTGVTRDASVEDPDLPFAPATRNVLREFFEHGTLGSKLPLPIEVLYYVAHLFLNCITQINARLVASVLPLPCRHPSR